MNTKIKYIRENKSALFDWLVFFVSISLGFVFPTLKDIVISPSFSYLMLAALLLYSIGAWLKHVPLSCRIVKSGIPYNQISLLLALLIGHWLIIFTVIYLSQSAALKLLGFAKNNSKVSEQVIYASLFLATYITWIVFQSKKKIKEIQKYSSTYILRRELVADIFLIAGVSILSFVFWEKGVMALLIKRPAATFREVGFMFLGLCIAYFLFYLPLRYLFLIEDHSSNQTWKRLLLIFGLLLIRSLFEMLSI